MMPNIATASALEIEAWKKQTHIGSPTSIMFLTGDQRQLWREKIILLLADYSTGFWFIIGSKKIQQKKTEFY